MMKKLCVLIACSLSLFTLAADEVVVYSSRNEQLIKPIFELFTQETGVKVTYRTDNDAALLQRIKAEGSRTAADVLLTVDAGNLWQAKNMGLLQPLSSKVLEEKIPAHLRDPEGHWFGFSVRARTLVYNTDKLNPEKLSGYEDLADPKWKGELLLRTSKKVYNQSLVAMLIATHGKQNAETIVKGWVSNLAEPVFSNDTKLMEALAQGTGSVGIVNSYYFGRLKRNKPDLPLALFWPDQQGGGVHVNVSGAGMTAAAKHVAEATRLLEWLASEEAQRAFADANMEYPADPAVVPDPFVASWGNFKQSPMNLAKAGELQAESIKLMDRAGYR